VSWSLSSFAVGVVQMRACRRKATRGVDTPGRRGRDTGSYIDRGERREVRAWAARTVKRLRLRGTGLRIVLLASQPKRLGDHDKIAVVTASVPMEVSSAGDQH
jgi:hypothetical protein